MPFRHFVYDMHIFSTP